MKSFVVFLRKTTVQVSVLLFRVNVLRESDPRDSRMEVSATLYETLSNTEKEFTLSRCSHSKLFYEYTHSLYCRPTNTWKYTHTHSLWTNCWTKRVRLWILYCTWTWKIHYDKIFSTEYEVLPSVCFNFQLPVKVGRFLSLYISLMCLWFSVFFPFMSSSNQ